jgi:hypothetical protein
MPLNSTGTISLAGTTAGQSIALELGRSATAQISLNDSVVRTLAGVSSGAITMPTNFLGKSSVAAPANTSAPTVSGVAQVGQTLSAGVGSWTGSPTGYSYQWLRAGTSISGATGSQYVVTSSDVGNGIAVTITATNSGGSGLATSAYTNAVIVAAPTNTALPTITGTAQVGQTLSAGVGSWTGSPYQYIYEWLRGGTIISGATGSQYVITSSDLGNGIAVRVRAVNGGGSTPATSAYTSTVIAAAAKYANAVISYSLGNGGAGGANTSNGTAGGTTTITYAGITLYAYGGGGGSYNNNSGGSGGGATGQGASGSTGGNGASVIGDVGGGGGGGIAGGAGNAVGGGGYGSGGNGGSAGDFSGFGTMIGTIGFSRGIGGAGANGSSSSPNAMNGSPGSIIGAGGGGAGWYGGNGGVGGDGGGGGGGAAGYTAANMTGGAGGQGLVFIRYYNSGGNTVIVRSSGTSYTVPSDTTSFEVWGIGGGGGGGGSTSSDGTSGSGGGAGGMIYRSWT